MTFDEFWLGFREKYMDDPSINITQLQVICRSVWEKAAPIVPSADAQRVALQSWFDAFLANVCEIPDRNSPEDEPDAMIATTEELRGCALNAIENMAMGNARAALAQPSDAAADCQEYVEFLGDNARDQLVENMARAMSVATDGHDRYWSGYVKSATAAHAVVAKHLARTAPSAPAVDALTDEQWEELRLIARTYNETGFPKYAREFFSRIAVDALTTGSVPIYQRNIDKSLWVDIPQKGFESAIRNKHEYGIRVVYTAPPAPSVEQVLSDERIDAIVSTYAQRFDRHSSWGIHRCIKSALIDARALQSAHPAGGKSK